MQFDFNNHLNSEILQQNRLKARSYFIPYENKAANAGNIAGTKKRRDAILLAVSGILRITKISAKRSIPSNKLIPTK